tara:strand:- start:5533 stop:6627 length:1095 start_codon:yes stop_codon:yes gene_type:complete
MSELQNDLESLVGDMGFAMSEENPKESVQTNTEPDPTPVEQPVEETVEAPQQEEAVETIPQSTLNENDSVVELNESSVLSYLSEKLGKELKGFEDLTTETNTSAEIDERVSAINEFVKSTGRDPQDWFSYQSMNPSEMDDKTVIQNQLKSQYPDLPSEDINLLVDDKYRLDEDLYDDSEIRLAKIQLKIDADKGRRELESIRDQFAAPQKKDQVEQVQEEKSFIDENWLNNMSVEVDALEGIEFEVAKDKSFTFGIEDNYKSELKSKNENIEDFFGTYSDDNGKWNFEKWNMHQTVLDNIETIVKTAYQQGLGEGQRGLVDKAANVQYQQPNETNNVGGQNVTNIQDQVNNALGLNDNGLTFKI